MSARPRIAFVGRDLGARELASLVPALEAEGADLVLVGREVPPSLRVQGDGDGPPEAAIGPALLGRAAPSAVALEAADPLARAVGLARAGLVDAVAGELGARPDDLDALASASGVAAASLRAALVRGSRVVVLAHPALGGRAGPGAGRLAPGRALDADAALATLELASLALARDLGVARPRVVACALDPDEPEQGAPGLARACARARQAGLEVLGPLPAEEALAGSGADAVLAVTRDQARLALVLGGSGAAARLVLGLPFVRTSEDPAAAERGGDAREASLRASVALAVRIARAHGTLVAEGEARRAAESKRVVAVTARPGPRADERCPYCRRPFDDDEPGLPCARCETLHHRACIHEHGRCTVHGCGGESVRAHGREVRIDRLGGDAIARHPFQALLGPEPAGGGLRWLRVEAPIDEPDERALRRELTISLGSAEVARGGALEGTLVLASPKPLRATGAVLRVRTALDVRPVDPDARPTTTPILDREALVFGRPPEGVLGRISSGVALLLGAGEHVAVPAGVRRWPFSARLGSDHPTSVRLSGPRGLEVVTTLVSVRLALAGGGDLAAEVSLLVT